MNVPLFSANGKNLIKTKNSLKLDRVRLADRILTLRQKVSNAVLSMMSQTAKFDNAQNENALKDLTAPRYPSNEGNKLVSIVDYAEEVLLSAPFTHSNQLYYTNQVFEYELNQDPLHYISEMKKYVFLPNNVKEWEKNYKKDTKEQRKESNLVLRDKEFWVKYMVDSFKKSSQDKNGGKIMALYKEWIDIYKAYKNAGIKKIEADREYAMYSEMDAVLKIFENKNIAFIMENYEQGETASEIQKLDAKTAKLVAQIHSGLSNEKLINARNKAVADYKEAESLEAVAYKNLLAVISKEMQAGLSPNIQIDTNGGEFSLSVYKSHDIVKNIKEWEKEYETETKAIQKKYAEAADKNAESVKAAMESSKSSAEVAADQSSVNQLYREWQKAYTAYKKASLSKLTADREYDMYRNLQTELPELESRNQKYITENYSTVPVRYGVENEQLSNRVAKVESKIDLKNSNEKTLSNKNAADEAYNIAAADESASYKALMGAVAVNIDVKAFDNKITSDAGRGVFSVKQMQDLSGLNGIPYDVLVQGAALGELSPVLKSWRRDARRADAENRKNTRHLRYEGFLLGLTSAWFTKSVLEDRLASL